MTLPTKTFISPLLCTFYRSSKLTCHPFAGAEKMSEFEQIWCRFSRRRNKMAEGQIAEKIGIRVAENRGTAKWDDGIMMEQEKHISQFNNRKWKIEEKTWQQSINKVWKNADTYQEKEGTGKFGQKSSAKLVLNVQLRSKFVHLACKQLQLILAIGRQKTDATNWIRNGTNRVRCQKRPEEKKTKATQSR